MDLVDDESGHVVTKTRLPCNIAGWELHYVKMCISYQKWWVFHCYVKIFRSVDLCIFSEKSAS